LNKTSFFFANLSNAMLSCPDVVPTKAKKEAHISRWRILQSPVSFAIASTTFGSVPLQHIEQSMSLPFSKAHRQHTARYDADKHCIYR
jgi:hypothetical protein